MTDIVERLHKLGTEESLRWSLLDLASEAADTIERLRAALQEIEQWARAYPLSVFSKPDLKRASELLRAGGMTLDAISADAMRHVVEGVGKIASSALEPKT